MSKPNPSRRDFVKRMRYVAPAVLTLAAAPEYAKAGSVKPDNYGGWEREKPGKWDWDFGGKGKGDKKNNGKATGKDK